MNTKLTGILTALLLFASILHSQTRPRDSLRGLNGVYVYVHPVGKDVESGGLSTSQIQRQSKRNCVRPAYPFIANPTPLMALTSRS